MNTASISALSALAGSAIGAVASFATTWLTQNFQDRVQRRAQALARRERLFGEFIDEASAAFADALTSQLQDTSRLVRLYSVRSKIRLFAPDRISEAADACITTIVDTYAAPDLSVDAVRSRDMDTLDFLRTFTERCREDLS